MATRLALTAVYETVESGWTQARVEELPAVITAAPTLDEHLHTVFEQPPLLQARLRLAAQLKLRDKLPTQRFLGGLPGIAAAR